MLEQIFRPLIRRIKAHPEYTEAFGHKLGLEGGTTVVQDLSSGNPSLVAIDKTGGTVEFQFTRRGSDGVNFYLQREQEVGWTLIGRAMKSPFLDARPLLVPGMPEIRRYTAVYLRLDKEVSRFNEDVVVTCMP